MEQAVYLVVATNTRKAVTQMCVINYDLCAATVGSVTTRHVTVILVLDVVAQKLAISDRVWMKTASAYRSWKARSFKSSCKSRIPVENTTNQVCWIVFEPTGFKGFLNPLLVRGRHSCGWLALCSNCCEAVLDCVMWFPNIWYLSNPVSFECYRSSIEGTSLVLITLVNCKCAYSAFARCLRTSGSGL